MGSLHDEMIGLLMQARVRIEREIETILQSESDRLSFGHWSVLKQLDRSDGRAMGEVRRATSIDDSTLTKVVDQLVSRGLVFRVADAKDRRKVLICTTEKGQAAVRQLGRKIDKRSREIMPQMSDATRKEVVRYLAGIAA